jgi:hypothetical protein
VFLQFAHALEPFREIVRSTPKPNAVHVLECLDTNAGCDLQYASNMLLMLTEGLKELPNVQPLVGTVVEASFDSQVRMFSSVASSECSNTYSRPSGRFRYKTRRHHPSFMTFVRESLFYAQVLLPRSAMLDRRVRR